MSGGISNEMHDELIGAGISNLFIYQMKMQGWLPIEEYFRMKNSGIDLDWILVLTMEPNNGFIGIPMVAEYSTFKEDSKRLSGWYNHEISDSPKRIDDFTEVIMFKPLEKTIADSIRDNILDEFKDKEGIENVDSYIKSFTNTAIRLCKGKSEHYIERMKR